MKRQNQISRLILTILIGLLAVCFMLPLLWMFSSALKLPMEVFESPFRWITGKLNWQNFGRVWTNPDVPFWKVFANSAIIALGTVLGQILVSSLAAYAFAKIPFRGKNVIFMLMLITMMIPVQALIIPRYMMFYTVNIYDTLWCMILPNLFNVTSIFLLRQFYMSLPDDLVEAATLDGAGHLRIWLQIMLPLTKNGIISAAILAFISSWNEYLNALVFLPSSKNWVVSQGIRWYLDDTATEYNLMMCAAASAIIPIIVLYISAQKYFEDGVAASGVKG